MTKEERKEQERAERELHCLKIDQEENPKLVKQLIKSALKYRKQGFNWYEIGYGLIKIVESSLYDAENEETASQL